mmetsp:Transcript_30727/g.76920  ORF Transcript_30727/g.76920 Transcript_30727/m.76920 type:complete len:384 (-) Transcript_30727:370-1521(-)
MLYTSTAPPRRHRRKYPARQWFACSTLVGLVLGCDRVLHQAGRRRLLLALPLRRSGRVHRRPAAGDADLGGGRGTTADGGAAARAAGAAVSPPGNEGPGAVGAAAAAAAQLGAVLPGARVADGLQEVHRLHDVAHLPLRRQPVVKYGGRDGENALHGVAVVQLIVRLLHVDAPRHGRRRAHRAGARLLLAREALKQRRLLLGGRPAVHPGSGGLHLEARAPPLWQPAPLQPRARVAQRVGRPLRLRSARRTAAGASRRGCGRRAIRAFERGVRVPLLRQRRRGCRPGGATRVHRQRGLGGPRLPRRPDVQAERSVRLRLGLLQARRGGVEAAYGLLLLVRLRVQLLQQRRRLRGRLLHRGRGRCRLFGPHWRRCRRHGAEAEE